MTQTRVRIEDGPSKFDLMVSFFTGRSKGEKPHTFKTSKKSYPVVVTGLDWNDGCGENWNFRGFIPDSGIEVDGFFSTQTRTGWMVKKDLRG